jgi:hypothetical protein
MTLDHPVLRIDDRSGEAAAQQVARGDQADAAFLAAGADQGHRLGRQQLVEIADRHGG